MARPEHANVMVNAVLYSNVSEWGDIMRVSTILSMIVGLSLFRMMNRRLLYRIPRCTVGKVPTGCTRKKRCAQVHAEDRWFTGSK